MVSRALLIAGCAAALSLAPVATSGIDAVLTGLSIDAYAAKGGNGGGNGGDNGGGRGSAKSSHAGNGNGRGSGARTRSGAVVKRASADQRGKARGRQQGLDGFVGNIVGAARNALGFERRATRTETRSTGKVRGNSLAARGSARTEKPIPIPQARPDREQNFHAKLAGLNSLNRNYHAYLNSNDPKMAAIQDYVMASAELEIAANGMEALQAELEAAAQDFAALVGAIEPHDDFSYEGLTVEELEARQAELDAVDTTLLSDEEFAALEAERQALDDALVSEERAALDAAEMEAAGREAELAALEEATTDEALEEALLAGANPNRVEEYGAESYVDQQMMDWAKDLLGVGDADGKIDEVRSVLESEEAPEDEELVASE